MSLEVTRSYGFHENQQQIFLESRQWAVLFLSDISRSLEYERLVSKPRSSASERDQHFSWIRCVPTTSCQSAPNWSRPSDVIVNTQRILRRLLVVNQSLSPQTTTTQSLTLFSSYFPRNFTLRRIRHKSVACNLCSGDNCGTVDSRHQMYIKFIWNWFVNFVKSVILSWASLKLTRRLQWKAV